MPCILLVITILQPCPLPAATQRVRSGVPSHFDQCSSIPQIVKLVMALLQAMVSLPTAKETTLGVSSHSRQM